MDDNELLIAKKERDRLKFKVVKKHKAGWSPNRYEKIIPSKDFHHLAYLFYDLHGMGYNVEKAYSEFRKLINEPNLFFLD